MSIDEKIGKHIGHKKIKRADLTSEKTPGGYEIWEIEFDDQTVERFSQLMLNQVISDKRIDDTALRDKRIQPIVGIVLQILRDWGIKLSELQYFSVLLQQSLDFNHNQALNALWSDWMPRPKSPDEVDMLVIDQVLKSRNVINPDTPTK